MLPVLEPPARQEPIPGPRGGRGADQEHPIVRVPAHPVGGDPLAAVPTRRPRAPVHADHGRTTRGGEQWGGEGERGGGGAREGREGLVDGGCSGDREREEGGGASRLQSTERHSLSFFNGAVDQGRVRAEGEPGVAQDGGLEHLVDGPHQVGFEVDVDRLHILGDLFGAGGPDDGR